MILSWVAKSMVAMPAKAPWIMKTCTVRHSTGMPAARAASALPPMA